MFDFEGTLVDLEDMHYAGHLSVARQIGVRLTRSAAIRMLPHFVGGPDELVAEEIWRLSNRSLSVAEIVRRSQAGYERLLEERRTIRPRVGVKALLQWLVRRGIPIAIGSVTQREMLESLISRSGLGSVFGLAPIVCREDVRKPKPAPDVYYATARRLRVKACEQLVFEDSPGGVEAARSAGARVIALPTHRTRLMRERLANAGAEYVLNSWKAPLLKAVLGTVGTAEAAGTIATTP